MRQINCIYAKRLIDKLIRFNRRAEIQGKTLVDIKQIKKAIACAKKYHKGQYRHSGGLCCINKICRERVVIIW